MSTKWTHMKNYLSCLTARHRQLFPGIEKTTPERNLIYGQAGFCHPVMGTLINFAYTVASTPEWYTRTDLVTTRGYGGCFHVSVVSWRAACLVSARHVAGVSKTRLQRIRGASWSWNICSCYRSSLSSPGARPSGQSQYLLPSVSRRRF